MFRALSAPIIRSTIKLGTVIGTCLAVKPTPGKQQWTYDQTNTLLETILQQNYFSFQNNTYQPEKGVSVGSPISNTAEIFLQYLKNTNLKQILKTKNIYFYARYVDDILMIYNAKHTTPETIHNPINKAHPNLQFTPTHEHNNSISFLDFSSDNTTKLRWTYSLTHNHRRNH
jgi:hypothetical protein